MENRDVVPLQQVIKVVKDEGYKMVYVNSIQVTTSLWDLFLNLGLIDQKDQSSITITNYIGVHISPQQAKALLNVLRENINNYEKSFGIIQISLKDQRDGNVQ